MSMRIEQWQHSYFLHNMWQAFTVLFPIPKLFLTSKFGSLADKVDIFPHL